MTSSPRAGWGVALAGGVLLGIATPPADLPGGAVLVVPALMAWFATATGGRRPLLQCYLFGCMHMAWFSWSVRHVLLPAYLAIVVVGGLYYLLAAAATRALPARWQVLGFAVAAAASFWLRACMPEIYYPHGQPCHCLWQWPALLGSVTLGGEPLANASLAGVAAASVQVVRSWRVAIPEWRQARRSLGLCAVVFVVVTFAGHRLRGSLGGGGGSERSAPLDIAVVEPGFHPIEYWSEPTAALRRARYRELFETRLVEPTIALLRDSPTPDVVLWPESVLEGLRESDLDGGAHLLGGRLPNVTSRLVLGGTVGPEGGPITLVSLAVDVPDGRIVAHQGKRRLVPGGEFLPLLWMLPSSWSDALRDWFRGALGSAPNCVPAPSMPPLVTRGGVPFGALMCYDNAFPEPAAEQVAQGARFLVVLSNEAWYRGGGELDQLVAMTVVRALEGAVPLVRCTQDGDSVHVDADGRVVDRLTRASSPQPKARILRVSLHPGVGSLPPMAWLRRSLGPLLAGLAAAALAHGFVRWVRLRSARTAALAAPGSGTPDPSGRGS